VRVCGAWRDRSRRWRISRLSGRTLDRAPVELEPAPRAVVFGARGAIKSVLYREHVVVAVVQADPLQPIRLAGEFDMAASARLR
jgi:hypothetical protein